MYAAVGSLVAKRILVEVVVIPDIVEVVVLGLPKAAFLSAAFGGEAWQVPWLAIS